MFQHHPSPGLRTTAGIYRQQWLPGPRQILTMVMGVPLALQAQPEMSRVSSGLRLAWRCAGGPQAVKLANQLPAGLGPAVQGRQEVLVGQETGGRLKMGQQEVPVPELGQRGNFQSERFLVRRWAHERTTPVDPVQPVQVREPGPLPQQFATSRAGPGQGAAAQGGHRPPETGAESAGSPVPG